MPLTPEATPAAAATAVWKLPDDLPRIRHYIPDENGFYEVRRELNALRGERSLIELSFPAGAIDYPFSLWEMPNAHLVITGAGAGTLFGSALHFSDFASVEIRNARFKEHRRPLTIDAVQHIGLHNLAFLDQRGIYQTTGHGVIEFDYAADLEVKDGGSILLSDVSLVTARGAWPAFKFIAPRGHVSIMRTLVADSDRTPFYVGIADSITIEDSVVVLAAGTQELISSKWPPDGITFRRSTVVADTPDVLVAPDYNPQTSPSQWLPTQLVDSTLHTRGPDPGGSPGVTLERSTIKTAPSQEPDFAAVRARAEALAPVERAAIVPLLGLVEP